MDNCRSRGLYARRGPHIITRMSKCVLLNQCERSGATDGSPRRKRRVHAPVACAALGGQRTAARGHSVKRSGDRWRADSVSVGRRGLIASICGAVIQLSLPVAVAQEPGRLPGEGRGWLPWAVAVGIVIVICVAGFLNPKRSHLG